MQAVNLIYPKKEIKIDSLEDNPLSKDFLETLKKAKRISKITWTMFQREESGDLQILARLRI